MADSPTPRPKLAERLSRLTNIRNIGEHGFDPFGFSPEYVKKVLPLVEFLHRSYFRVTPHDVERVPDGRVILASNHSGQLPFDGVMIGSSLLFEADPPRIIRSMVDRSVPQMPFVSTFFARCGQIVGTPSNCERLLHAEEAILVFPEGVRGISKTWWKRYQLQSFGTGFVRLAIRTGAPIVPVAVVGAEEQQPAVANVEPLAKLFGMPSFPITPTFPLLGPLGLLPAPSKYDIYFGEPFLPTDVVGSDPNADEATIQVAVQRVKDEIAQMIAQGRSRRTGWFG